MAFSEQLAARIRRILSSHGLAVGERKMFGGLCFLVNDTMCCGVLKDDLIVRIGPDEGTKALALPHTRPFDFTGRPARGMVYVAPAGVRTAAQLERWVQMGLAFAASKVGDASPTRDRPKHRAVVPKRPARRR